MIADAASRIPNWHTEWNKCKFNVWVIKPSVLQAIEDRRGHKFEVDAFCDAFGNFRRAPEFWSLRSTAFQKSLGTKKVWAFPPPSLGLKWLEKVLEEGARNTTTLVLRDDKSYTKAVREGLLKNFKRIFVFPEKSRICLTPDGEENEADRLKQADPIPTEAWVLVLK